MSANGAVAQKAFELGFTGFGVCDVSVFDEWMRANLTRHEMGHGRLMPVIPDPREILPDASSLIVVAYPYAPIESHPPGTVYISPFYFAYNKATHASEKLLLWMNARGYEAVHANRLPLKAAAARAGVGCYTKHGLIMDEAHGTYLVIKAFLTSSPCFETTDPLPKICVDCDRCIARCPTGAIKPDGRVNINLCLREMMRPGTVISPAYYERMEKKALGCDHCQVCCPMNPIRPDEYTENMAEVFDIGTLLSAEGQELYELTQGILYYLGEEYGDYRNLLEHTILAAGNEKNPKYLPALHKLKDSGDEVLKTYAAWAIQNISSNNP